MTGPGPGKILLKDAEVYIDTSGDRRLLTGAAVYVHLKGYSRARVTHIDIEHEELNKIFPPRGGGYYKLKQEINGIIIDLSRLVEGLRLIINHPLLAGLAEPGREYWCYVGGKHGGIYIGLKKHLIQRLEERVGYKKL